MGKQPKLTKTGVYCQRMINNALKKPKYNITEVITLLISGKEN